MRDHAPTIDDAAIGKAVELLARSERPMIAVGGGAQAHSDDVTKLAELLTAP